MVYASLHYTHVREGVLESAMKRVGASSRRGRVVAACAIALYAALLGAVALGNAVGPERWWWSTLNLYLPQWLWAVPGVLVLAVVLRFAWRWVWAPLACLAWVAGPLMGLEWHAPPAGPPAGTRLRVMTYNVKYGRGDMAAAIRQIRAASPDLLLLQDAGGLLLGRLGDALRPWHVASVGQYVVASRFPIESLEARPLPATGEASADFNYLRTELQVGGCALVVYDLHLLTPREGLSAVKTEQEEGIGDMERNARARLAQAEVVAAALREETGPVLLAGDLNAPDVSLVCRRLRETGLRDAFAEAGRGYGYTYGHSLRVGRSYMRIDHILLGRGLRALECRAGGALGSQHRPVIADVALTDAG